MEGDKYEKTTKRVSLGAKDSRNEVAVSNESWTGKKTKQSNGNTMLTVKGVSLQSMSDDISADVAMRMSEEINQIFENTKREALKCIDNTKREAITFIENARRKALQCIWNGGKQEWSTSPVTEEHPDKPAALLPQKSALSKTTSLDSENVSYQPHFEKVEEEEDQDNAYIDNGTDMEAVIKDNLHRYKAYIADCVKATDLIAFYDLFTTSQTKSLRSIYRRSPYEATENAFEAIKMIKNQPDKYMRLLSALKDTGYPKVVQILEGVLIPVGSCHRETIRTCEKHIFQQLNTTEVLRYLFSKGVISDDDKQQIQRTERTESTGIAALELLDLLPNRSEQWLRHFIDSLTESGHDDLAKLLAIKTMHKMAVVESERQKEEDKQNVQSDGLKGVIEISAKAVHTVTLKSNTETSSRPTGANTRPLAAKTRPTAAKTKANYNEEPIHGDAKTSDRTIDVSNQFDLPDERVGFYGIPSCVPTNVLNRREQSDKHQS